MKNYKLSLNKFVGKAMMLKATLLTSISCGKDPAESSPVDKLPSAPKEIKIIRVDTALFDSTAKVTVTADAKR
jgi:hypothetical protein